MAKKKAVRKRPRLHSAGKAAGATKPSTEADAANRPEPIGRAGSSLFAIFYLAAKDLIADKKTVTLVVALLVLSFVNLTLFASFIRGLGNTFQNELIMTETGHIVVQPRVEVNETYLAPESLIRKKLEHLPGVMATASHTDIPGIIYFEGKQMSTALTAIKPSDETRVTWIDGEVLTGQFLSDSDMDEIMIGKRIAGTKEGKEPGIPKMKVREELGLGGVTAGETVIVQFANGLTRTMHVKAIVGLEGPGIVNRAAYITRRAASAYGNLTDEASKVLVRLSSKGMADKIKPLVLDMGIPNADVKTYDEASSFVEALDLTFGIVGYITAFVGLLIAMSTTAIVMTINVNRKRRSIAVMKAIGASAPGILSVFLIECVLFGTMGVALGIIATLSVERYLSMHPVYLPIGVLRPEVTPGILQAASVTLFLAVIIAGLLPALSGARQGILEYINSK